MKWSNEGGVRTTSGLKFHVAEYQPAAIENLR